VKRINRRRFLRFGLTGAGLTASSMLLQGFGFGDLSTVLNTASKYANSATKSFKAVSKALEDITPEQEYYIGRTIGAIILDKYRPYDHDPTNQYINILGQTLSRFSDMPELYDGYHFMVLDSPEINAFATPSGLIFVTRGMLHCCSNEGSLAAVLAHEIAHVQHKHGLQSIEKDRITKATSILAIEATKSFAESDIANLTSTFEDSISDITSTMISSGYSRAFENEADETAVIILQRVGYSGQGLIEMLGTMQKNLKPGGLDFAKTHPSPESRIENISELLTTTDKMMPPASQSSRFQAAMKEV
jgi:predicted Zn-dependent protease